MAAFLASIICICTPIVSGFLASMIFTNRSEKSYQFEDLFIDETHFPPDIDVEAVGPNRICVASPLGSGCRSVEATGFDYYFPVGFASEDIHRYRSIESAANDFPHFRTEQFEESTNTIWTTPSDITFSSSIALSYFVACTLDREVEICQLVAQYREFIVLFKAQMVSLNHKGFEELIRSVDAQMAEGLLEQPDG